MTRFNRRTLAAAVAIILSLKGAQAMAAEGLITIQSSNSPEATMNRFKAEVKSRGMTVFADIDHAAAATAASLSLRPTDLLIFGNAKAGTPLMQNVQAIGIDLPLKALVWQDASGVTWLSYNDPSWLAQRHALDETTKATIKTMSTALQEIASKATAP